MRLKSALLVLTLLVSAAGAPQAFAASGDAAAQAAAAKQQRLIAQKKAQQQAALKKQQALAAAKAKQDEEDKAPYADDRDRGLDIAHEYAPKAIDRIRAKGYVAKGDTVNTGNGKRGWQQYVDKYAR
jgi:hypothetical protein